MQLHGPPSQHSASTVQDDISRFVARLIAFAIRNAVLKDNAGPPSQSQKGSSTWAVHVIMNTFAEFLRRRDLLQQKFYPAEFFWVVRVSRSYMC